MFKAIDKVISKCAAVTAIGITMAVSLSGCDLVREESDCVASYNIVSFVYDHNMKFADAFDHEVSRVTLFAFDHETGRLVKRIQTRSEDPAEGHSLVLDVQPGEYDLLVWGGDYDPSFDISNGTEGESSFGDFHAYMRRARENGESHVRDKVVPLFHGKVTVTLPYASPSKPNRITVPLIKDTNTVRVVLQQLSGEPVDASDFIFTITDGNGWLNADNTLRDTEKIIYHPYHVKTGSVDINTDPKDLVTGASFASLPAFTFPTRSALTTALAEFSVGRLTTVADPILHITRPDGKTVLSVNIRDYALLVKGETNGDMDTQEYLDRQDEYNMTFFLDKDYEWVSTVVIINDWRIIRNEGEIS